MLFQSYTASSINNIYHPVLIEEQKSNINKADYEDNLEQGVYNISLKKELDKSMN